MPEKVTETGLLPRHLWDTCVPRPLSRSAFDQSRTAENTTCQLEMTTVPGDLDSQKKPIWLCTLNDALKPLLQTRADLVTFGSLADLYVTRISNT